MKKGSPYVQVRRTFFYNINYSIPFICTLQAEFFLLHFLAVLPSYNCIFLRVYCKLLLLWRLSKYIFQAINEILICIIPKNI